MIQATNFDIGASVFPSASKILFASVDVFNLLQLKSNYHLFFSTELRNFNGSFLKVVNDRMVSEFGPISKVNFYSLIEDFFVRIRTMSFFPTISFARLQNNFYDYVFKQRIVESYGEIFSKIFSALRQESRVGYRMEMTVRGHFLSDVHDIMRKLVESGSFKSMSLYEFIDLIEHNAYMMICSIRGNTLEALGRNVITETILKEWFVKGSQNPHFLPKTVVSKIKNLYSSSGIKKLVEFNSVVELAI